MLALLAVLMAQAPEAARAESLLAAGALPQARALAERLVARSPLDPSHHQLLGRIWLAWPVVGRYQALQSFRTAARLAPHDPAPLYGQVEVGFYLGSDEGEVMAREALLRIFALDPDYRDSWARFRQLFRNERIMRRADAALALHPDHPKALQQRAELAIELGDVALADSLAQRLTNPIMRNVLRADAAFLSGRDSAGQMWHDSAVALAAYDSTEVLWERAWTVASPAEAADYAAAGAAERPRFFERFWAVRDPVLLTAVNERLGEHTRRLAEARDQFRLLHPMRMVYRSAEARSLEWFDQRRWLGALAASAPEVVNGGSRDSVAAIARVGAMDVLALQNLAHTRAARAGLDARGLVYMRYGRPDLRVPCDLDPRLPVGLGQACTSFLDFEGWLYRTPAGDLSLGFRGAEYFFPASSEQLHHTEAVLRTDATTVRAPATVRGWTAFFLSADGVRTDTYVAADADAAAVALWSADGGEHGRVRGTGLLAITAAPGTYRLGLDIDSAGVWGRLRDLLAVPDFATGALELSSLVLARDSAQAGRDASLAAMPADLAFARGGALGAYAEIYGLSVVDDVARYRARYTFAPVRSLLGRLVLGRDPVSFEFERLALAGATVVERLQLEPGRVPPGRYRVTLEVTDVATNVKSETVALVVTLR